MKKRKVISTTVTAFIIIFFKYGVILQSIMCFDWFNIFSKILPV
ncbi:unnamed protein product [Schistosoma margrebowiei]|uniref:Uncharacterized protein n=1 Tax=Schistosoma margrebowiei TaxID=48269 RepID=A0A183MSU5_9TREM|nr:unnamed protein product [Schistosoma margrebowiei]